MKKRNIVPRGCAAASARKGSDPGDAVIHANHRNFGNWLLLPFSLQWWHDAEPAEHASGI